MSYRATQHSGRLGLARHNDRQFDISKADHIDPERLDDNRYYCCYADLSFQDAERKFYTDNFREMIQDINDRAERSYHPERKTNPDKLLKSKKTMPEEVIYQIGNKDDHISTQQLTAVFNDFNRWHKERFGSHVKTLNIALHADEATPHIHLRRVWVYDDPNGILRIGQHKALEQLGYQLPDPAAPRGRRNNLKMVYTAECREKWIDICREHGLDINDRPQRKPVDKENLQKNDYIIQKQNDLIQQQQKDILDLNQSRLAIESTISGLLAKEKDINQSLQKAQEGLDRLKVDKYTLEEQIEASKAKIEAQKGKISAAADILSEIKALLEPFQRIKAFIQNQLDRLRPYGDLINPFAIIRRKIESKNPIKSWELDEVVSMELSNVSDFQVPCINETGEIMKWGDFIPAYQYQDDQDQYVPCGIILNDGRAASIDDSRKSQSLWSSCINPYFQSLTPIEQNVPREILERTGYSTRLSLLEDIDHVENQLKNSRIEKAIDDWIR